MRLLVVLIAFASALAGCTLGNAPSSPRGDGPDAPDATAGSFREPVAVARQTAEPGLLLDPAGTVWVHAPGGLWKSRENATKFDRVDFGLGLVLGGDADLAISKDGKSLYYTDLEELAALSVFSSHDSGKTWFEQPIASDAPLADRQWIAIGKNVGPIGGSEEAVYLAYNQLATGVWVTKSTDGGLTWTPHLVFATSQATEADFQTMGNIVVDPKGVVHVAYTLGSFGAPITPAVLGNFVVVSSSEDGGVTWTRHDVVKSAKSPSNIFAIVATDVESHVYVVWAAEGATKGTDVFLTRSTDKGKTWSKPVVVNAAPGSRALPWVAAGDEPGELVFAWYEANETARPADVKGDWVVKVALTKDANSDAPTFKEYQASPGTVHSGPICMDGVLCRSGRGLLDFFEARLDASGFVHVSYAQDTSGREIRYVQSAVPLGL